MSGPSSIAQTFAILSSIPLAFADIAPLSFSPSLNWTAPDGDWSTVRLGVGEPQQQIDVAVSTSLSELWFVHDVICSQDPTCISQRGGFYDPKKSSTWLSLGPWQMSLDYLGYGGNGDYALENVFSGTTSLQTHLVATFNGSSPSTGFLGLGIVPQKLGGVVQKSPISRLVEESGLAPSHSYGFTAGARYMGTDGTPLSLIMGGYDRSRFEPHDITFALNRSAPQPQARLRSITASVPDLSQAPTTWDEAIEPLLLPNETATAIIDSSTPYLWLPTTVADRFAARFSLVWSESYKLYTFKDTSSTTAYQNSQNLSLTFTLSSYDNVGNTLEGMGVLNLTISGRAFLQKLRYPFMNLFNKGDAEIPYFPLRRAEQGHAVVIGRAFLQETYLLTSYESQSFNIYQARFPEDPAAAADVVAIPWTSNSPYPGPANNVQGLTTAQIAGIVVGICVSSVTAIAIAIWWCKRRKSRHPNRARSRSVDSALPGHKTQRDVGAFLSSFFPFVGGLKNTDRPQATRGLSDSTWQSSQHPPNKSYDRFETPTPTVPIELSRWGMKIPENTTTFTSRQYEDWTMYCPESETRPQIQPSGQWTLQQSYVEYPSMNHGITPLATYLAPEAAHQSARHSSSLPAYGRSATQSLSPINATTYGQANHYANIPSPVPLLQAEDRSDTESLSSADSYDTELDRQAARIQNNIVTQVQSTNRDNSSTGEAFEFTRPVMPSAEKIARRSTSSSLGSNFTVDEQETQEAIRAAGRIGQLEEDLVHIPQPRERRYSWEGEQTSTL